MLHTQEFAVVAKYLLQQLEVAMAEGRVPSRCRLRE
jgi:hypothetical protein